VSDDTEIKYLRIEISDKGTIEVSGTAEFVDSLSALFVSGIAKNVQYRAQRVKLGLRVVPDALNAVKPDVEIIESPFDAIKPCLHRRPKLVKAF